MCGIDTEQIEVIGGKRILPEDNGNRSAQLPTNISESGLINLRKKFSTIFYSPKMKLLKLLD